MWKLRGLDQQLFDGAAAKIWEFLDVTPLMPPARLRFSKMLGRPLMGEIGCNCCALVTLDEARRLDCEVAGQHGNLIHFLIGAWPFPSLAIWRGPARDAPADLVGVCIVSSEDAEFGKAWLAKYEAPWPNHWIDDELVYDTHPDLLRLDKLYQARCQEWKIAKQRRLEAADLHPRVRHIPIDGNCPDCGAAFVV
jgi:hypothetical protein